MLDEVAFAEEYLGELRPVALEVDLSASMIRVVVPLVIIPNIQQEIRLR